MKDDITICRELLTRYDNLPSWTRTEVYYVMMVTGWSEAKAKRICRLTRRTF